MYNNNSNSGLGGTGGGPPFNSSLNMHGPQGGAPFYPPPFFPQNSRGGNSNTFSGYQPNSQSSGQPNTQQHQHRFRVPNAPFNHGNNSTMAPGFPLGGQTLGGSQMPPYSYNNNSGRGGGGGQFFPYQMQPHNLNREEQILKDIRLPVPNELITQNSVNDWHLFLHDIPSSCNEEILFLLLNKYAPVDKI